MIYVLIALIGIFIIVSKIYMFENRNMAEVAGEPVSFPLFTFKSGSSFICWLTGVDLTNNWVSPIYRGFISFFIGPQSFAIELGIGLAGLLIGVKSQPPYLVVDIGRRLGKHMID